MNKGTNEQLNSFMQQYIKESPEKTNLTTYINQLSPLEKKAMLIAYDHLKSSFDLLKSNGYVEWEKNGKKNS